MNPLKRARLGAGLTQLQLAARAGIDPCTVSRIERGGQPRYTRAKLEAVLGAIDWSGEKEGGAMKVTLGETTCVVERGDSQKMYSESWLFTKIRDELRRQGHDVIKKAPEKDGNLTSMPYYIRSRNLKKPGFHVSDGRYALRSAYQEYNEGRLVLDVGHWEAE